jgi:predicted dehydrogenase
MTEQKNRRQFLRDGTILGAGLAGLGAASLARGEEPAAAPAAPQPAPAEPFVVGIIGTGSRGQGLASGFAALPNVHIKYLCDVDDAMIEKAQQAVAQRLAAQPAAPDGAKPGAAPVAIHRVKDLRKVLEDKEVHAVAIAAPDHWHAPAGIMACAAGKHVYVEKPCSHNPREGELLVESARKHNRVVQHGTQRRSWPGVVKAIQAVRGGEIGAVRFARAWYAADRGTIGRGKPVPPPSNLDYAMWQGPAPERPYHDNVIHYNWHWFWHWGTGELGNNGVHFLDLVRWGLNVDYPKRVSSSGGRYCFSDDQETPDTQTAAFDFGDKLALWECRSCQPRGIEGQKTSVSFHGDRGTLVIEGNGFRIVDRDDKVVHVSAEQAGDIDAAHLLDFVDAARTGRRPAADIEDGHRSTLLCQLGNIALRAGRSLHVDPKSGRILDDKDATDRYWSREYRPEWEPKV